MLYSLFVHPVTAHVKERFLDFLGWRRIDVLLSILSFHSQSYDSCHVEVVFFHFCARKKFSDDVMYILLCKLRNFEEVYLIKQNQKLDPDSVLKQSTAVPSDQNPASKG